MTKKSAQGQAGVSQLPRRAQMARFTLQAEHARTVHHYITEAGVSVEEITQPEFWAPLASLMRPWDRLEVVEETGSWICELIVLSAEPRKAIVHLVRRTDLPGVGAEGRKTTNLPGHVVEFGGSHVKWLVRDGEKILRDGFQTEAAADLWLSSHSLVVRKTKTPGDAA